MPAQHDICSTQPYQAHPLRRWLNQADAADYIGVTERTIRNYVSRGAIRAHRIKGSRLIRFDRHELDAALRPIPAGGGDLA